MTFENIQDCVN